MAYLFTTKSRLLTTLKKEPFENNVGKEKKKKKNAGKQRVLFFPTITVFYLFQNKFWDEYHL